MSRTSVRMVMAIVCAVLLVAAPAMAEDDSPSLEEKVKALSKSVDNLEDMVKDLSYQLEQAQSTNSVVKEVSYEIKQLEGEMKDLQNVQSKVEKLPPQIASLESKIDGVAASSNEKIKVLQGRVYELETTVDGLDSRLQTVEGKVRELLSLEKQVTKLSDNVDSLSQRVAQLADQPNGPQATAKLTDRIESIRMELSGQTSELSERISRVENEISNLPISSMQANIEDNRSRIDSLESTVSAQTVSPDKVQQLQSRIMELEEQMQAQMAETQSQSNTTMAIATAGLIAGLAALAASFGLFQM